MSKSSAGSLFGSKSRPGGAVTVVEVSLSRSSARRALIVFWLFTLTGVTAGVAVALFDPARAVLTVALGALIGVGCGLLAAAAVRAWLVLRVLWHWTLEVLTLTGLLLGVLALADGFSWRVAGLVLVPLAALVGGVPSLRRRVMTVVWCVVVRHRLRLCFAEFIRTPSKSNPASAPLILLARPTPAGERVWVWLRPGLDLTDLDGKTGKLAVACWASEVRVIRASRRFAALIRVDVARRDPLTGRVSSPLAHLVPAGFTSDVPVSPGLVPVGLDLPDVPDPDDTPTTTARPARSTRANANAGAGVSDAVPHEYDAFI